MKGDHELVFIQMGFMLPATCMEDSSLHTGWAGPTAPSRTQVSSSFNLRFDADQQELNSSNVRI